MAKDEPTAPTPSDLPVPGDRLSAATMPAHWLLARLGKKVMRPGGLPATRTLLEALAITTDDDVVDLAPGLGVTVQFVHAAGPKSFRGLERSEVEAERARRQAPYTCVVAQPEDTGLEADGATVVYGEAVLTLETDATKERIVEEAARLLRSGGRLGLHELLLVPDDLGEAQKRLIEDQLTRSLRVRARPLTLTEWTTLLDKGGFDVERAEPAPFLLLDPATFVRDEGLAGTARFLARTIAQPAALRRVAQIWTVLRRHRHHIGAVTLVARRR